jgi:light-regulated signal transduction histidine kinase (bacteriophytochrome)
VSKKTPTTHAPRKTVERLEAEVEDLRRQLNEAWAALDAIRGGNVDPLPAASASKGTVPFSLTRKSGQSPEEALRRSAEELARSNADLQEFASAASHDLQEPLRTIGGFVQLLQRKHGHRLDAEAQTFIQYAVDGVQRMETLIRDLLAYSRVNARGKELTPTDASAALSEALGNLHAHVVETSAEISCGELPTVRADAAQLVQVFQNLLGNSLKFRSDAAPKIEVTARRAGDFWQFSLRDNGIGIEPKYHDTIFEAFRSLHTRDKYPGSGLGLVTCKKIVERHGGRIWVESQLGEGAAFHFTLPV